MREKIGMVLAVGLLAGGCAGPEAEIPKDVNFYHEPPTTTEQIPCGSALGALTLREVEHKSETINGITVEYLGFRVQSVFPEGSDPSYSCAGDTDGIVWVKRLIVPTAVQ